MVGYDLEDKAYCMELTFNYGLTSYKPGTGLKEFGIYVPDVAAATAAAQKLNYKVEEGVVVGPDSYRFRLLPKPEGRTERFLYVLCRTKDLEKSVAFYKDFLGMSEAALPAVEGLPAKASAVSYTSAAHPHKFEPVMLILYEDGVAPELTPWEGRHAFALPATEIHKIYAKYQAQCPERIMHDANGKPIQFEEALGTLSIFIARDADGYELCLVSRETMLPAAVQAVQSYDPSALDWATRDKRIGGIAEAGKEVEEIIAKNKVVIFSKEWCPFAGRAKSCFDEIKSEFYALELEDKSRKPLVESPAAFQEYLAAKTNAGKSVPKVFIKGSFLGGGDDVVAAFKSGQLLTKCVAAGAAKGPEKVEVAATNKHFFVNGKAVTNDEFEAAKL